MRLHYGHISPSMVTVPALLQSVHFIFSGHRRHPSSVPASDGNGAPAAPPAGSGLTDALSVSLKKGLDSPSSLFCHQFHVDAAQKRASLSFTHVRYPANENKRRDGVLNILAGKCTDIKAHVTRLWLH